MNGDQKTILLAEIERLARRVQELRGLTPDAIFYGLPLWVQVVSPAAVEVIAADNALWDAFRAASHDAFEPLQERDSEGDTGHDRVGSSRPSAPQHLGADSLSGDPEKSLMEIAEAIASGDPERINEASISRIANHVSNARHTSFAMITSFRREDKYGPKKGEARPPADNNRDFKTFKGELQSRNLAHTKMKGQWKNEDGSVDSEPSTFVHGISRKAAVDLGYKHHQRVVAYIGPETQWRTHIVWMDYANGNTSHHGSELFADLGEFHPNHGRQFMLARKGGRNAFPLPESLDSSLAEEHGWIEYEPENIGQAQKLGRLVGLARATLAMKRPPSDDER